MGSITLQSVISRKDFIATDMDGDIVMMSVEKGKYYNLGKTGGVIWKIIAEPVSVETVVNKLLEKYEVTRKQCEAQTLSFLNEMDREELIEVQ
jgi:hypothetical protein